MEIGNAKFLENDGVNGSEGRQNLDIKEIKVNTFLHVIKEIQVNIPLSINVLSSVIDPNVGLTIVEYSNNNKQHLNDDTPNEETNPQMSKRNES